MKRKMLIGSIFILLIILLTPVSFAATGTVEFKSDTTEIKKGETFTVILSATSEDGINGIDTKYTYDTEKLELISANVADNVNWSSLGATSEITVICNSTTKIKNANLYILKFKVKENVAVGSILEIKTNEILLDTDLQTDSEVSIQSKKVEVKVVEDKNTLKPDSNNSQNTNKTDKDNSQNTNKTESNKLQNENKIDATSADNTLPQTGNYSFIILANIVLITIFSVITYKKYRKYKDIN